MSTRPTRVRTWAPVGKTPVIQETFGWKSLSIIGGLSLYRFYFQIHPGSIKGPQVIDFLRHLQRHIPGKRTVVWDGAPIHRSRLVKIACYEAGYVMAGMTPYYARLNKRTKWLPRRCGDAEGRWNGFSWFPRALFPRTAEAILPRSSEKQIPTSSR